MAEQDAGPYNVLAEILVSQKVGLDHIRLVGELIVTQARLNASPAPVSADLIELVILSEDGYKKAWEKLNRNSDPVLRISKLEDLERSLRDTILTFERVCEQLQ